MPERTRSLAQIIAVERKLRKQDNDEGATLLHGLTEARVTGQLKEYKPDKADEELAPSERSSSSYQVVQAQVEPTLRLMRGYSEAAIDIVATKDLTNTTAKADVVADGAVIWAGVPVSHLLWLEGYLQEWRGSLASLPVLSSTRGWKLDSGDGLHKANPEEVAATTKETVPLVLHPGNDKHPPQVQTIQKDIRIGRKITTVHSGALPVERKRELLERCDKLIMAVKDAVARANASPATEVAGEGSALLGYIFGS